MAGAVLPALADASLDRDGMPVVYLRGDFNNTAWGVDARYRFTRNGNDYSLTINSANAIGNCKFKIGDDDWEKVDIGGNDINIVASQYVNGVRAGANMRTPGLRNAVISFTYEPDMRTTEVKFVVDGIEPSIPTPPDVRDQLSGTLPVLFINVYTSASHTSLDNEVISKDLSHKNYFEFAEYWLETNGCEWLEALGAKNVGSADEPLPLQIKARGNWTRIGFSKKPFKLKLDKKQSLLGLSKSKHFALLAHADDRKGYLRNFTGFELGKRIGLPWTPSQQPVEVIINGDYRGLYFLTESIRVDEDRVNITELADNETNAKLASGGYIVELDNYDEDESAQIKMEEKSCASGWHHLDPLRITFDTPEVYSDIQRLFIREQFEKMNDYVGANDDRIWSYLDLDDAARYYVVQEIVSHTESYHGSTYLFRDYGDGQKWHFSPLWDFGNAFNGYTDDYFYNCDPFGNTWIPSMRENAKFNAKVRETWLWFMQNEYPGVEADMAEYASRLKAAAQADFARWNGKPVPSGGQEVADNRDMDGRLREVKDHISSKISWLKRQWGDYNTGLYSEPERDTTPAAELPIYVSTGMSEVEAELAAPSDGPKEYFNLQGIRVERLVPGQIYIVRSGDTTRKSIAR